MIDDQRIDELERQVATLIEAVRIVTEQQQRLAAAVQILSRRQRRASSLLSSPDA